MIVLSDAVVERQTEASQAFEIVKRIAGEMLNEEELSYTVTVSIEPAVPFGGYEIWLTINHGLYNYRHRFHPGQVLLSDGERMIKYYIIAAAREFGEAVFLKPGAINRQ